MRRASATANSFRAALFGLLLGGLTMPALAGAAWDEPVDLSAAGQDASNPQVAVDADGDAVFTWHASTGRPTSGSRPGRAPRPAP